MNVKEIVIKFLEAKGAAGLFDDESGDCSCTKDDLFLCGEAWLTDCKPMYEVKCKKTGMVAFSPTAIDGDLATEFVEKHAYNGFI